MKNGGPRETVLDRPLRLRPVLQNYAWGSRTALAQLRGEAAPSTQPEAELWMGAHDVAPSLIEGEDGAQPLNERIADAPARVLGDRAVERFGDRLPFLFKILAAERPLSIQAHPSQAQAAEGFARENELGIALDDPQRNYRDASHKPELICALSAFDALYGFRKRAESQTLLTRAGFEDLAALLAGESTEAALHGLLSHLLGLSAQAAQDLVERASRAATAGRGEPAFDWVARLLAEFPGDPMCITPLFLNVVHLEPGESLYAEAGVLHSYLSGTTIEIMANSDNVVRAGLTSKHIDTAELLGILDFSEVSVAVSAGSCRDVPGGRRWSYDSPAPEFHLQRIELGGSMAIDAFDSLAILVCTSGACRVGRPELPSETAIRLSSGECALIPRSVALSLEGEAALFLASVP